MTRRPWNVSRGERRVSSSSSSSFRTSSTQHREVSSCREGHSRPNYQTCLDVALNATSDRVDRVGWFGSGLCGSPSKPTNAKTRVARPRGKTFALRTWQFSAEKWDTTTIDDRRWFDEEKWTQLADPDLLETSRQQSRDLAMNRWPIGFFFAFSLFRISST